MQNAKVFKFHHVEVTVLDPQDQLIELRTIHDLPSFIIDIEDAEREGLFGYVKFPDDPVLGKLMGTTVKTLEFKDAFAEWVKIEFGKQLAPLKSMVTYINFRAHHGNIRLGTLQPVGLKIFCKIITGNGIFTTLYSAKDASNFHAGLGIYGFWSDGVNEGLFVVETGGDNDPLRYRFKFTHPEEFVKSMQDEFKARWPHDSREVTFTLPPRMLNPEGSIYHQLGRK